ncbi:jmjd4 [Symbiodinium natans]|uniref:Jmjd4 protein n=1 Tax=Symbiodinium natans TaxID=878477 RepID=A0A812QDS0_9DINO|nr:jmjd4 [Symbiodinium natans]
MFVPRPFGAHARQRRQRAEKSASSFGPPVPTMRRHRGASFRGGCGASRCAGSVVVQAPRLLRSLRGCSAEHKCAWPTGKADAPGRLRGRPPDFGTCRLSERIPAARQRRGARGGDPVQLALTAPGHGEAQTRLNWPEDLFDRFPRYLRPSRLCLFGASKGAKCDTHADHFDWTGWNLLLAGRKRWRLLPNTPAAAEALCTWREPFGLHGPAGEELLSIAGSWNTQTDLFEQSPWTGYEVVQEAGELLLFPGGWFHQTKAEEASWAVCAQLLNGSNADAVLQHICDWCGILRPASKTVEDEVIIWSIITSTYEKIRMPNASISARHHSRLAMFLCAIVVNAVNFTVFDSFKMYLPFFVPCLFVVVCPLVLWTSYWCRDLPVKAFPHVIYDARASEMFLNILIFAILVLAMLPLLLHGSVQDIAESLIVNVMGYVTSFVPVLDNHIFISSCFALYALAAAMITLAHRDQAEFTEGMRHMLLQNCGYAILSRSLVKMTPEA